MRENQNVNLVERAEMQNCESSGKRRKVWRGQEKLNHETNLFQVREKLGHGTNGKGARKTAESAGEKTKSRNKAREMKQ